jgi:hypothetical protein
MRIAISGTHGVGKSTLVEALGDALADHRAVDEPYVVLVEDGHEFAEEPALEDFEQQLRHAIDSLGTREPDLIFDRCPLDLLGYLLTHPDADGFDLDRWLPRVRAAIAGLDLIVFVPVEEPERIALGPSVDVGWRRRVDDELREILIDDRWGLGIEVIEVTGSLRRRVEQVCGWVQRAGS